MYLEPYIRLVEGKTKKKTNINLTYSNEGMCEETSWWYWESDEYKHMYPLYIATGCLFGCGLSPPEQLDQFG